MGRGIDIVSISSIGGICITGISIGALHSPDKNEHTCNINKKLVDIYIKSYMLVVMTDISKYRNVSLTHETYNTLKKLSIDNIG